MKNELVLSLIRIGRWSTVVLGLACGFYDVAHAQQRPMTTPQFEASAGYSFVRANAGNSNGGFNLNGASGSLAYNFTDRFSILADFGGYKFSGLPSSFDSTMYTYLFGPRISLRKWSRVNPFAQVLLGGGRLTASSGGIDAGENGFAMTAGGGVDIPFRPHISIRIIQAEYLLTRFARISGASATQNDVRVSAGFVYRFGHR